MEVVHLVEEGQGLKMQLSDASKEKTKDGICGDGLIREDSLLF